MKLLRRALLALLPAAAIGEPNHGRECPACRTIALDTGPPMWLVATDDAAGLAPPSRLPAIVCPNCGALYSTVDGRTNAGWIGTRSTRVTQMPARRLGQ